MPHIHTEPNQHDMTVSAYILLREDDTWKCLVHMHKKIGRLMQIGGHIDLNETPWQAMAHELEEESGFRLSELELLQPFGDAVRLWGGLVHPLPFTMNTHGAGNHHYHSDTCYGFIAERRPTHDFASGESDDVRWMSITELQKQAETGEVLEDVATLYAWLIAHLDQLHTVDPASFSLGKPEKQAFTYKTGAPGA